MQNTKQVVVDEQTSGGKKHHWLKVGLAVFLGVILVTVAGWAVASARLLSLSVGSTKVPAHYADAQLKTTLTSKAAAYKMTIGYPDGEKQQFLLSEVGLKLDGESSLQATRKQQTKLSNRLVWWRPVPAVLVFHRDTTIFQKFIVERINITVQPSHDATLTIKDGNIVVTDAVTGIQYGLKQPDKALIDNASSLQTKVISLQTLKTNPALSAAALAPYKQQLEKAISQTVTFTVGYKTVTPTPAQIASWLDIGQAEGSKKLNIAVNSGKVSAYIRAISASSVHPPRAQVVINQPDDSVKVLVDGVNGQTIPNEATITTDVADKLLNGQGYSAILPVTYQAFSTVVAGDYPKWIEVDLTSKRMYAYESTNLVQTYLVSAGALATPTVVGQYAIYSKLVQQDMRGRNVDGTNYFQPHVPWINYFYKDYAIHGNYWRPTSYFGNINSSHGCVSLVNSQAEWIFNWAPVGTPVINHY